MKISTIIFFLVGFSALSQEVSKTVLAAGGEPLSNTSIQINFTLGEPVVGVSGNSNQLQQGFWSGSLQVIPLNETQSLNGLIVYPNPVETIVNISTGGAPVFGLALFTMDNRKIMQTLLPNEQVLHEVNLEALSQGVYVLQIYLENTEPQLFKIIKK